MLWVTSNARACTGGKDRAQHPPRDLQEKAPASLLKSLHRSGPEQKVSTRKEKMEEDTGSTLSTLLDSA